MKLQTKLLVIILSVLTIFAFGIGANLYYLISKNSAIEISQFKDDQLTQIKQSLKKEVYPPEFDEKKIHQIHTS